MHRVRNKQYVLANRRYVRNRMARKQRAGAIVPIPRRLAPLSRRGFNPNYGVNPSEKKVIETGVTEYIIDSTGNFRLMNLVVLGADYNQRIGRKTINKSMFIRGYISPTWAHTLPVGTVDYPTIHYRMIIFIDCQPNGVPPTILELLNTASPSSMLNLNNRDRFLILKDKMFQWGPYQKFDDSGLCFQVIPNHLKIYKRLNLETIFSTSAGTVADISSNCLWMFQLTNRAAPNTVTSLLSTRVRFVDN